MCGDVTRPPDVTDRWEDWFEPGETLLWEGGPAPGVRHPFRNVFFTAFGLPFLFGGLAVFGAGIAMGASLGSVWSVLGAVGLMAFSIPFLAVGIGMVAGPWYHDLMMHRRGRYAVSTRAGYVATRWWGRDMNVIPIRHETRIEYDENRDGTGSVWFHFERVVDGDGDASTQKQGFEGLASPREVYDVIREVAGRDRETDT